MSLQKGIADEFLLRQGKVLVWTAELDTVTETRLRQLARLLSRDENQRALRFRFERDRNRFVVCRGILREILGTFLQRKPEDIEFNYGPQGKPYIHTPAGTPYFNVSHSSSRAIYALGLNELGVDLEFVESIPEMQELVDQHFSAAERTAFGSIPHDLRVKAFYSCWTRKEAYVKACGGGLSIPLDQFDVSVDPRSPARLVRVQGTPGNQLHWSLHSFEPSTDTVAALVCAKDSAPHLCGCWSAQANSAGSDLAS